MTLSLNEKKRFRTIGHNLKPVVIVAGNGLSDSVVAEVSRALEDHELIKVKLALEDREDRSAIVAELCDLCGAELIQTIGKMALLFRKSIKPKLKTSNIRQL